MWPDMPYFIILLCLTPDDVTRQGESAWIQYMHYKKLSDNENINLKMPRFLRQGNLHNRASKIKRLLARHEFHLPRASVKLHLCLLCILENNQK
jgi:N-glycosylase/DNA lyase